MEQYKQLLENLKFGASGFNYFGNKEISRAKGVWYITSKNERLLDLYAGAGICSLGHSHDGFVSDLKRQLDNIIVCRNNYAILPEYVEKMVRILPKGLNRFVFFTAGSEAVDFAIRIAKSVTGKSKISGFTGGYHGKTSGIVGLASPKFRGEPNSDLNNFIKFEYPESTGNQAGDSSELTKLTREIEARISTDSDIAAIILEPIQGTSGNTIPVEGLIRNLRIITKKYNVLLILDEIVTGFGRTGSLFSFLDQIEKPDILILGKGIANGVPLSALVLDEEIVLNTPFDTPSATSTSFSSNALSICAALSTLNHIEREKLDINAKLMGELFLSFLKSSLQGNDSIVKIDGKGLMISVKIADHINKDKLCNNLIENKLVVGIWNDKLRINPPLVINEEEVFLAIEKLKICLTNCS